MIDSRFLAHLHTRFPETSAPGRFLGRSVWGFADQALISAANFAIMVLLARHLGPSNYGAFVVTYTVLLMTNSVQGALFTQPHNVLGATRTGSEYREYTTATALAQILFSLAVGSIMLATGLILFINGHERGPLILALAPTSFAWQMQEFARRVLYTKSGYFRAFLVDSITFGLQVTGVVIAWMTGILTTVVAIAILGLSSSAGAIAGFLHIRRHIDWHISRPAFAASHQRNWIFGRWLLAGSTMSWLSSQVFPILTAGVLGTAAAGGLRAAQTLLGPTHILLKTIEATAPSRAAQAFHDRGRSGALQSLGQSARPIGVIMLAYCILVAVLAEPLTAGLLGPDYVQFAWLVRIFAIYYLMTTARIYLSVGLKSMGLSSAIFYAQALGAAFVMSAGIVLVHHLGLAGAAIGLLVSAGITLYGLATRLRQHPNDATSVVTSPRYPYESEAS